MIYLKLNSKYYMGLASFYMKHAANRFCIFLKISPLAVFIQNFGTEKKKAITFLSEKKKKKKITYDIAFYLPVHTLNKQYRWHASYKITCIIKIIALNIFSCKN